MPQMPRGLSDDALVVRGGQSRNPMDVLDKLLGALEDHDLAALSVYALEPSKAGSDELLAAVCSAGDVPHKQVQVSRVGILRAAGFELEHDTSDGQTECHYNVGFGNAPDLRDAERFIECFHGPIPNPTGGRRRRQ